MNKLMNLKIAGLLSVALLAGLGGCSKKRVAECDAFVATVDKLAKCSKIPEAQRTQLQASAKQIKDALKTVDDAGGFDSAPADLVKQMADTCKTQEKTIVDAMAKLDPDCVK